VNVILAKSKEDLYQVDKKICMNFQFKDDDIRFEKFQYFPKKENIRTKNDNDDRQDDSPKNSPKKQNTHIKKNDSDDDEQDNSPKNSPKKKQNTHIKKNDSDDDEQDDSPKNILKKEQNFPNNIDELDIFIDEENIGYLNNISISNNLENLIKKMKESLDEVPKNLIFEKEGNVFPQTSTIKEVLNEKDGKYFYNYQNS